MDRAAFRLLIGTSALLTLLAVPGCAPSTAPDNLLDPELGRQEARQSTPTGAPSPGYGFSTTLLSDGRVLTAGGLQRSGPSAEIYDPATGLFSATASLPEGHDLHATVRLLDGQVLLTGGMDPAQAVYSLRYDPLAQTWSPSGTMGTARLAHGAVLLPNGQVLVTGGTNYAVHPTLFASCELFHPTTNTWTSTAPMSKARAYHSTMVLLDGRVLVTGGESTRTAELYDPATGTWSVTGSPAFARQSALSLLLPDGRVLVVGGRDVQTDVALNRAELYDPATGTWIQAGVMNQARNEPLGVVLSNGKVLVFSGSSAGTYLSSVERYDPSTNTWSVADPMLRPHYEGGAVLLSNEQILLVAGQAGGSTAELYTDNPACTPVTCASRSKTCGVIPNGCGGMITCGSCTSTQVCTTDNVCASASTSTDGAPLYDSQLNAPRCSQSGSRCSSKDLLKGRAALGPEPHTPNTLVGSPCADGAAGTWQADASLESLQVSSVSGPLAALRTASISAQVYASAQYTTNALDLYAANDASAPVWTFLGTVVPTGSGLQLLQMTYTLPVGGSYQAIRGVFRVGGSASTCGQGSTTDTDDLVFPVDPPPPPTTALTAPNAGSRLQGQVLLKATATSGNGAITRVEFYAAGTLLCSDTTAPYECDWDSLSFPNYPNGSLFLKTIAYDSVGASGSSTIVSVSLVNDRLPPTASMQAPTASQLVRGTYSVVANLTDDADLTRGEVFLDGAFLGSTDYTYHPVSTRLTVSWNSTLVSDGAHTLFARAYDSTGKTGDSAPVQVIVDNTPPTAAVTSPATGSEVVGTVQVTADAGDLNGIQSVALLVNGMVLVTKTSAPYAFSWNSQTAANGTATLQVLATDMARNQTTSAPVSVTVNNLSSPVLTAVYDATRKAPGCASAGQSCDSGTLLNGRSSVGPESHAPNTLASSCQDGTSGSYHSDESLDRLKVSTLDGTALGAGKTVRIEATVWAYTGGGSDVLDLYYTANANNPSWTYLTSLTPSASGQRVLSTTYSLPVGALQAVRGVFRYGGTRGACVSGGYNDHDDLFFVTQ